MEGKSKTWSIMQGVVAFIACTIAAAFMESLVETFFFGYSSSVMAPPPTYFWMPFSVALMVCYYWKLVKPRGGSFGYFVLGYFGLFIVAGAWFAGGLAALIYGGAVGVG